MKKATELRTKFAGIESELYQLSEDISKEIEYDGIDIVYLKSKFQGIVNVVSHVNNQLKYLSKNK